MCIGGSNSLLRTLGKARLMRVYRVNGRLGLATQDFWHTGRLIEKTTYREFLCVFGFLGDVTFEHVSTRF